MTGDEYQKMSGRTAPTDDLFYCLSNYALGVAGETGELVDHIKKVLYQGHPISKAKVCEESGDLLWYLAGLLRSLDISLSEAMVFNIEKLKKRYPNGFDVDQSLNREVSTGGD